MAKKASKKSADKKRVDGVKKTDKVWPKLKGMNDFRAKKGKVLLVVIASGEGVRLDEKRWASIDCDKISYSAKNILKRALMDGDIECAPKAPKGGR